MVPPPSGKPELPWTIIVNFDSEASLAAWKQSAERGKILGEVVPLVDGGNFGETVSTDGTGAIPGTEVTEVIFSKVRPGMADRYREWAARIQAAQAKYRGYRGMYLQPPTGGGDGHWTSILRYDSAEHLEAWMNAPGRRAFLSETREFIESEELIRLATAFPGWVPIDPMTGEGPPNWKAAMLVLLGLFPNWQARDEIPQPDSGKSWDPCLAGDVHRQCHQCCADQFPHHAAFCELVWLVAVSKRGCERRHLKRAGILCVLFALEVIALWRLLLW